MLNKQNTRLSNKLLPNANHWCHMALAAILMIACSLTSIAQPIAGEQTEAKANEDTQATIDSLASSPDFIRASLLIASPGSEVYSAFGHAALRMQCPSESLDFCFTFEMDESQSGALDFVRGKAYAGFAAVPTQIFLKQYAESGRGVTEYLLNLKPKQEQNLWRELDTEVSRGPVWTYAFPETNCTSMLLYVVDKALVDERIDWPTPLPAELSGTYGEALDAMSARSPWIRLFWRTLIGSKADEQGQPNEMIWPVRLGELMPIICITGANGLRSLAASEGKELVPTTLIDEPFPVSPTVVANALIIAAIVAVSFVLRKKKIRTSK